ncbi:MAG: hypothetical protein RI894_962 [Bacteroidota bacterium]|jgi:mRNA-degrading endonuclease RelE of RelBE toxin-antitoxin system
MIKIYPRKSFSRHFKKFSKRYPNILSDLDKVTQILGENPKIGIDIGDGFRKIRMAISDKKTGKNGGARVITYQCTVIDEAVDDITIDLLHIYDKSETANVSNKNSWNYWNLISSVDVLFFKRNSRIKRGKCTIACGK